MKKIIFYTLLLGMIVSVGCGGDRTNNSDRTDMDNPDENYNYRNGRSTSDTSVRDSVDSVLLPTPVPTTPPTTP